MTSDRIPLVENEDERSREIGYRSGTWGFIALSALLLEQVVMHVVVNGFADLNTIRFELGSLGIGWAVFIGVGLYYNRVM